MDIIRSSSVRIRNDIGPALGAGESRFDPEETSCSLNPPIPFCDLQTLSAEDFYAELLVNAINEDELDFALFGAGSSFDKV